jgi:DNA mismatch endonuclease (patch repair protein)
MTDVFDDITRSNIMRQVKSSGNLSTELKIIKYLKNYNITGWRRKSTVYGKPDFVINRNKIAIFVDGCFWHGHKCKTIPINNREYWLKKISGNIKRDQQVNRVLRKDDWHVFRFWECHLNKNRYLTSRFNQIKTIINQ